LLLSSIPTPRQKCVHPRDRSHGQKWHRCSHLEKTSLLRRSKSGDVGVAWPRSRANKKLYKHPFAVARKRTPDDLPLHDVKDFAVAALAADGNGILHQTDNQTAFAVSSATASHPSFEKWWSQTGSNRRPPACKAGALPTELWPRKARTCAAGKPSRVRWWAWEDLNFRPHAYQARALTS
jgi:hypothetical protein